MSTNPLRPIDTDVAIKRTSVPALDAVLGHAFPILDHGFIRIIDYMGDDNAIVQAARVSYGEGTKKVSDNQGLINYLMRHWHSTPFEMCEIKLHVKLPVFVARQWIRHRTANVNEYSARYSIMDREFYIPEEQHLAVQSKVNNQGRGEVLTQEQAIAVQQILMQESNRAYDTYEALHDEEGEFRLARELARMNLPTNIYTQWYWKTDLHNLFHFMRLRADSHAQYEIRAYAEVIEHIVGSWVPMAMAAYAQYRKDAVSFSGRELHALALVMNTEQGRIMAKAISNMNVAEVADGTFSKGEWNEFLVKLSKITSRFTNT